MGIVAAERIKLTSTRSPKWCAAIVVVIGVGFAVLMALSFNDPHGPTPSTSQALAGMSGFATIVLMIMGILAVTTEYRFNTLRSTFQAVPNRTRAMLSKYAVVTVFSFVLSLVLTAIGYAVTSTLTSSDKSDLLSLSNSENVREFIAVPLVAAVSVLLALAVGTLLRHSAGAISLVLVWALLVENLVGLIPKIGRDVQAFLPFNNANLFTGVGSLDKAHWGPWGGLAYFVVFTAAIVVLALVVVNKRDA